MRSPSSQPEHGQHRPERAPLWARHVAARLWCIVDDINASVVTACRGRWDADDEYTISADPSEDERCGGCCLALLRQKLNADSYVRKGTSGHRMCRACKRETEKNRKKARARERAVKRDIDRIEAIVSITDAALRACLAELQRQTGALDPQLVIEAIGEGISAARNLARAKASLDEGDAA